jgi:glycosyltransferase involved in cell wall biosynthesis
LRASEDKKGAAKVRQDSRDNSDADAASLRIVHVLRAPVGGLFRHVLDLAREQIARGHEVGLITDSLTGGGRGAAQLAELTPSLSLGLMRLPIRRPPHVSDISVLLTVGRRLAELNPSVVHGHGSKGGFLARLAGPLNSRFAAVRIYTPHGGSLNYHPGTWSHRLFMAMEAILAWRTDLLLFESGYIADRFESFVGKPRRLARVVRNGIAPRELEPVTPRPDAADLLYVGEFRSAKGLDTLIDALGLLAKTTQRRPRLVLVGDGPEKTALSTRAETLGVASQLSFRAPMAARDAFAEGRILVVPSRSESLPYIVLEAAGAHKPIIATRVGGMAEIFGPYSDRLIPCDNPGVLRDALARMFDETKQESDVKIRNLAEYVGAHFSLSGMVDGVVAGYREAIARRARS